MESTLILMVFVKFSLMSSLRRQGSIVDPSIDSAPDSYRDAGMTFVSGRTN